jgi:cytoskeletal protein CcmA (bactofilin family)
MKFAPVREPVAEQPIKASVPAIGALVTINGNIDAASDLHIEGSVVGDVRCQTLFLGESGKISGSIHAARVRVAGTVEGGIEARDIAIEPTARVTGDVSYTRLRVANGATLEGKLKWERPAVVETPNETSQTASEAETAAEAKPASETDKASEAEPAAAPIHGKPPIRTDTPFSRRHHGPRGRAEPIRGPIGAIEPTMTFTDDAVAPRMAK